MSGCSTGLPSCMATSLASSCTVAYVLVQQCQPRAEHTSRHTQSYHIDVQQKGKNFEGLFQHYDMHICLLMSRLCPYAVPVQVPCQAYTPVMHALAGVDIPCASCACISNHKTACASTQPVCELRHVYLQKHRFVENQSYPKFMAFNDSSQARYSSSARPAGADVTGL